MSAPRTKRQFAGASSDVAQRQITSFFTSTANTATSPSIHINHNTSPAPSPKQNPSNLPKLPTSVQANLLSVGMRVRKSVPEGYKTGNYNAFALLDENDTSPPTKVIGEGQRSRANAFSSPRELLPFCGIHKVGGLDTQPEHHDHTPSTPGMYMGSSTTPTSAYQPTSSFDGANIYGATPELTTSQESVESNSSSIAPGPAIAGPQARKRYFVEEEEEENPKQLNLWRHNHDVGISSRSLAPAGRDNNGRVMAVPRKGKWRGKASGASAEMSSAGQENVMVIDGDFEEADFLDRGVWDVDMNDA
ncbi:hypothetical protein F4861DRAFT_469204 [Xylaria intraflava]|nr:hypothetical protein F4861DRAFT_469204 [Xylaria intraflava]